LLLAWITDNVPSELHYSCAAFNKIDDSGFGTLVNEIRLSQDAESSVTCRIYIRCKLEYLLGCDIDVRRNNSKHYRPRVFYISKDYVLDQFYVSFRGEAGCGVLKDAGDVNHAEMLLIRSGNL